jgi:hypothetical protein
MASKTKDLTQETKDMFKKAYSSLSAEGDLSKANLRSLFGNLEDQVRAGLAKAEMTASIRRAPTSLPPSPSPLLSPSHPLLASLYLSTPGF